MFFFKQNVLKNKSFQVYFPEVKKIRWDFHESSQLFLSDQPPFTKRQSFIIVMLSADFDLNNKEEEREMMVVSIKKFQYVIITNERQ